MASNQDQPKQLKRAFRFGVLHLPSKTFVPIGTVGLAKDGGIFIAPVDVIGDNWTHGPISAGLVVAEQSDLLTTSSRPKLHYHRSGAVRATLAGRNLPARTSFFRPIAERGLGTVVGITATHPRALEAREPRRGDVFTIEGSWPDAVKLTFALFSPPLQTGEGPEASFEP